MKNKILQCKKIKLYTRHIDNLKRLKQKITDKLQLKPNWELFVIFVSNSSDCGISNGRAYSAGDVTVHDSEQ